MESGAEQITVWSLFLTADPIVKIVMLILAVASIWSWAVAVDKWLQFGDLEQHARKFEREFWSGRSLDEMEDRSDRPRDALSRVYAAAAREWREARRVGVAGENAQLMLDRVDRLMAAQVSREMGRASRNLGVLATVGASSPFIGLFGTVWGIMNAFTDIASQQQTNLAVVAPGIAEALFATALGLVAAIPAVIFYNKFTGDLDRFGDRLDTFSDEVAARLSRRLSERP
ncbi:protein TolQ [Terricaulis silvestris]|uniref:Biopolymer transport protein ExbB n=1 Tax=Terricaulis silvestris TaxID=2686094 RepID=A0A6I6MUF3_9CAUL|nr:protein TolQ [Terricaulis silvestris]QGZ96387.1 Biopolymer transport protein ExbB [Terricaulis silvestris]